MRVAVTTAFDTAPRMAAELERRGFQPVVLPCIEVVAAPDGVLGRIRRLASEADLIIVTSARAVELVWPEGGMPDTPVAAVGHRTAAAVEAAGGRVEITGPGGGEALFERIHAGEGVAVFPHARAADLAPLKRLRQAGMEVVAIPAYETVPVAPPPDPVDAATFASPSAVAGWTRSRSLDSWVVAAIGPTTAAALAEVGRFPDVVATRPGLAELAEALREHVSSELRR